MLAFAEEWTEQRGAGETYWDFEEEMREWMAEFGRVGTELMLSAANAQSAVALPGIRGIVAQEGRWATMEVGGGRATS